MQRLYYPKLQGLLGKLFLDKIDKTGNSLVFILAISNKSDCSTLYYSERKHAKKTLIADGQDENEAITGLIDLIEKELAE